MRKRLKGCLYGCIRSDRLAAVVAKVADIVIDEAYWFRSKFSQTRTVVLPTGEEARSLLQQVSPKPCRKREIRQQADDPNIIVSVIVPVYNTSAYLTQCLDSLKNQKTEYTYEVIVIDDGSTDQSGEIANKYSQNCHFRVIHQNNRGFSGARNAGLDQARGKYVSFVDSDDYVSQDYLQTLISTAEKEDADIVEAGYNKLYSNKSVKKVLLPEISIKQNHSIEIFNYTGFFWGKLFRRNLFQHIRLPEGFWYEDTILHFLLFRSCKTFRYLPTSVYNYRINNKGITKSSAKSSKAVDTYWILEECLEIGAELNLTDLDRQYYLLIYHCGFIMWRRLHSLPEEIKTAAFVMACNLIIENKTSLSWRLPYLYREVERALLDKDYSRWNLAAQFM